MTNMENAMPESKHSAVASMQGYMYQCRFALLEMLRRMPSNPCASVSIETIDDVVFEVNGRAEEIIQLKHHINRKANLTDASVDIWKTIGIWIDLFGATSLSNSSFVMITTAQASADSAAYHLTGRFRDIDKAVQALTQVAQTSTSKETQPYRDKYLKLSDEDRKNLFNSVYVIDCAPQCDDLEKEFEKALWSACQRDKLIVFLSYLEGWWFQRVIKSFSDSRQRTILGEELDAKMNDLRNSFKDDSLPIADDLKVAEVDCELYKNHAFVKQLQLIEIGAKRISIAVNNFYRAFEQRSRWMREELLYIGDIDVYEKRLVEEWQTHFEAMREEIGAAATEQEKTKAAQALYKWVEQEACVAIRERCNEPFVTRGSYHILSNNMRVGWHAEFQTRLEALLGIKKEVLV